MSNTDRMSMLERWADGMETLEQYYEDKYGPPATPAQLPAITTYDGMLEAIADGLQRAKRNINKKSPTYHSDSVVYAKTVPSGDVHYASLEQIGGKTLVWNQLISKDEATIFNTNYVSYDSDTDTYTVSYPAGDTMSSDVLKFPIPNYNSSHVYYTFFSADVTSYVSMRLTFIGTNSPTTNKTTLKNVSNAGGIIRSGGVFNSFMISKTNVETNAQSISFRLMIFDLTLMFGSGNEPTTISQFREQFPAQYYPYNEGQLMSAGVTEVVSKKADTTEIATYSIPAEVRALSGYGWSCPDHYNYIDFEAKKYVQAVGSRAYDAADDSDSTVITDGTTTYYALSTAVETDISAYLTDDNLISVESGGTLTFPNSNGDDYRIDVPSSETFVVGEP